MGRDKKEKSSKKQKHKHKHKKEKKKHKKSKRKSEEKKPKASTKAAESNDEGGQGFEIPIELMNTKSHAPESKEEYERRQSKIRHEKDPVTGRIRLIKGDSEVLEEIVSRDRSHKINKAATASDGEYFQAQTVAKRRN